MNIDFQGMDGVTATAGADAVLQPVGIHWNVNAQGFGGEMSLVTSYGAVSGLRLWTYGLPGEMEAGDALYRDYLSGDFEIRGLEANQSYELVLYTPANLQTEYEFYGEWTPMGESVSPPARGYGDPALPGVEGSDYLRGVIVADGAGVVAIGAGLGGVAGLQLDVPALSNPEPGVLLLQGLAALFGLTCRRR